MLRSLRCLWRAQTKTPGRVGPCSKHRKALLGASAVVDPSRRRDRPFGWLGASTFWAQFADPAFLWLDAMALVWALFMLIVFVVEPIAHPRLAAEAARDPGAVLRRLWRAHLVLLLAAIVTILGAVAGAHGGFG